MMKKSNRRTFITQSILTTGFAAFKHSNNPLFHQLRSHVNTSSSPMTFQSKIDFRYSPPDWQSTFCFPDDESKSLVGKDGDLRYGHPGPGGEIGDFAHRVLFGIENETIYYERQYLESPAVPIITTHLNTAVSKIKLTCFATKRSDEGRVDNVIVEVNHSQDDLTHTPVIMIHSKQRFQIVNLQLNEKRIGNVFLDDGTLFCTIDSEIDFTHENTIWKIFLQSFSNDRQTFFVRLPQAKQTFDLLHKGLFEPESLLNEARSFWKSWSPTNGNVTWRMQDYHDAFFTACARNIVQSRVITKGKKAFQVGPTCYRGLWVIDGNFLLEAARYMGYDQEAQDGLESLWTLQNSEGGIFAGGGDTHWKDTAATMYATARQADLAQDWRYFTSIRHNALKGIRFLRSLRDKAHNDGTANGSYGLLPQGFGDSGIGGVRSELANTLWTVFGLKGFLDVADRLAMDGLNEVRAFYNELHHAFMNAAKNEMRTHPNGFSFLPLLMKEDKRWNDSDEKKRPKAQAAQVYMSHAIYPGLMWKKDDAFVTGHIELMKAIIQEDIPAETGWLAHDAVWGYNAPIAAQVFLWAGLKELARKTCTGFLNHASPLYAWREEQSLQGYAPYQVIGDMPHNWASAECIRFLRHIMILEDGDRLRLLDGIIDEDLREQKTLSLTYSPTKWGRVSITLEAIDAAYWKVTFKREDFNEKLMPVLSSVELPINLSLQLKYEKIIGAGAKMIGDRVVIEPEALTWEVVWRA